jgi:hypothetical protein
MLRTLVLDTLLEEGGHCAVEDEQASEWLQKLDTLDRWTEEEFEAFARFFGNLDTGERTSGHENVWVYSMSTPFLTRLSTDAVRRIVERNDGISAAVVEKYCDWARNTSFEFNFADNICGRLNTIFDNGTPADKAQAFAALVELGHSHNRWYIMRCMLSRCKSGVIEADLAKRLAIELKTEGLQWEFKRCVSEVTDDPNTITPELAIYCST